MKAYLNRLKNPATVASIVSFGIIILVNFGISVDSEAITNIVNAACGIGILLGVMNDPTTNGIDLPTTTKTKNKEEN